MKKNTKVFIFYGVEVSQISQMSQYQEVDVYILLIEGLHSTISIIPYVHRGINNEDSMLIKTPINNHSIKLCSELRSCQQGINIKSSIQYWLGVKVVKIMISKNFADVQLKSGEYQRPKQKELHVY